MVASHGVEVRLSRMRRHGQSPCEVEGREWTRGSGDRLQGARVLPIPLGWPVGFISVPSWALLSLSPHPHAVLSLALAAGSLLPPPFPNHGSGPQSCSSPLSGEEVCGALLGRAPASLTRWARGGDPGLRAGPPATPLQPERVGRGDEGSGCAGGEELRPAAPLPRRV